MVKNLLKVLLFSSFVFLLFLFGTFLNPHKSLAILNPNLGDSCTQQQLGQTYTVSGNLIVCKPGWNGTANTYTYQIDSGPGSCPGGFTCGSGGGCFSCSLYNRCTQASYAGNDGSGYSCVAKLPTPTGTTSYPIVTPTLKGEGASCYYGYECQSGVCNGAWIQLTGRVIGDNPPSYPGTCGASPTPTSTCGGTTGRLNGCTCSVSTQCASNFCDLSNSEYQGTNTCKTLSITPTPKPSFTPTPSPTRAPAGLACDPNKDGKIDTLDFQWWKDELLGAKTTKLSDCFHPDGAVNLLDFQVWKDISVLKIKAPF